MSKAITSFIYINMAVLLLFLHFSSARHTEDSAIQSKKKTDLTALSIQISSDERCANDNAMVWLSQNKVLIQQIELTSKSSVTFFVNPGKFDVSATSKKNMLQQIGS